VLSGTIQNDILEESVPQHLYLTRLNPDADHWRHQSNTPRTYAEFIRFRFRATTCKKAGAKRLWQELAFTLPMARILRTAIAAGMDVDRSRRVLSFFFCIGMKLLSEAGQSCRAARLCGRIMDEFKPQKPQVLDVAHHCRPRASALQEQDPINNVVRTAYEAMSAVLGGNAVAAHRTAPGRGDLHCPRIFSVRASPAITVDFARRNRRHQRHRPLGGSYYVEKPDRRSRQMQPGKDRGSRRPLGV